MMITREYYLNKVEMVINSISTIFMSGELLDVEFTEREVGLYIDNILDTSSFSSLTKLGFILFSEYYRNRSGDLLPNTSNMIRSTSTISVLNHIKKSTSPNIESAFINYVYLLMLLQPDSYGVVLKLIELRLIK